MDFRHGGTSYFGVWFFLLGQVGVRKDYLDFGRYRLGYHTIFSFDRTDTTILSLFMTPNAIGKAGLTTRVILAKPERMVIDTMPNHPLEPSPNALVCPLSRLTASARRGSLYKR
jgi:hypothetical protein